jgi:putative ABC transport system permease protein
VAILIIIIAAINFMNLSTAQAPRRAKEVGIKKVSGSSRGSLMQQFVAESVILAFSSLVLAVIIIENALPYFSNLLGVKLQMNLFGDWFMVPALLILSLIVGLLAGTYPAFFLSSYNPALVLKGKPQEQIKHGRFRSILVILQFSISVILIVGTIIMARQLRFMLNKNLGFNKEQLMVITRAYAIGTHVKAFKEGLLNIPEVKKVTFSSAIPGHSESGKTYAVEGRTGEVMDFKVSYVDNDFFDTYGMKMASGRTFNDSFGADKGSCIVNESTVSQLNLTDPLNTRLVDGFEKLAVVGVIRNFHFESLHTGINPYLFRLKDDSTNNGYISIRLSAKATAGTIKEIEKHWDEFSKSNPFQYFFIDQDFAQKYKEEKQSAQLSIIFSILAIIVASMGLFGLTSFTIEQRTKEIGIRKAMGASITGIFYLVTREFILLVTISTIISWPLIYYIASNWLRNYYYRIHMSVWDFLAGFIIALAVAMITISFRAIQSAKTDPVETLRYE